MKKFLGMLLFISFNSLFAREFSLQEIIDMALLNDKNIKISQIAKENSNLDMRIAFKSALPNVTYKGSFEDSSQRRTVDNFPHRKKSYQQGITFSQPLFRGGAVIGGIIGSEAWKNIADLNYLTLLRDIRLSVITIYSNILILEKNLTVYETSKKELESTLQRQQEQLKLKLITLADLLKTESSILDIDAQIIDALNSISILKLKLKIITGIPEEEEISLLNFSTDEKLTGDIDFQKDLDQALKESLAAKIAANNLKFADAQRVVARASLLPQVNAFAQYGGLQKKSYRDTLDEAYWQGGLNISWDVFSFGKEMDNYTVAKNNEKIEAINSDIIKDNIRTKVTDSFFALLKFEKLIDANFKNFQAAKENLTIDSERYRIGLISTTDYLISFSQYVQTNVNYNTVLLQYYIAFETYRSLLI